MGMQHDDIRGQFRIVKIGLGTADLIHVRGADVSQPLVSPGKKSDIS